MLALTYEFSPADFERVFSNVLKRSVQVDVIAGRDCEGSTTHARFWRANWPGLFHPKMICLLAGQHLCVGLGSANLTSSGMGENLEAWAWFESPEDRSLFAGVREFLQGLQERGVFPRRALVSEFIEALPKSSSQQALVSVLRGPLLPQVLRRLDSPIQKVDIVTPINGDPSALVTRIATETDAARICLYTGGDLPVPRVRGVTDYFRLAPPTEDDNDENLRAVSVVHAKLFAFHCGHYVDLFWGSANLSYSAWVNPKEKRNIEFLVHTRLKARDWRSMRDGALPPGHKWESCQPIGRPRPAEIEKEAISWSLLHAVMDDGTLRLEASGSGPFRVDLRAQSSLQTVSCPLTFKDAEAAVPGPLAMKLECFGNHAPRWLMWRMNRQADWRKIPVNLLAVAGDRSVSADLVQQLYWEYSGRNLPRPTGDPRLPLVPTPPEEEMSDDERELTLSEHQGELDRLVLEWRLIARRVGLAAGENPRLRQFHFQNVVARVLEESRRHPERWPSYRVNFVRQLLERRWRK